ncbi:MAG: ATP-binding protein [Caulobacteraceae bacterium]
MAAKDKEKLALRLLAASNRNMISRLSVVAIVVAAALPVMPWWQPLVWACSVFTLLSVETFMIRRAKKIEDPAQKARVIQRLQFLTTYSSVNYSAIALAFWWTGAPVAMVFATVLVMVVILYFLMLYYTRLKLLMYSIAPLAVVTVLGAGHLAWQCLQQNNPWAAVTAVLAVVIANNYFVAARRSMSESWDKLRAARAQAVERGVAAEAASRAKSAFLATMSHEIRTPLNGVLGMAQAIAADELSPVQRERLNVVRQSGEALLAILNDILDISKIEAGKLDLEEIEFDLENLVETAHLSFAGQAESKGLIFTLDIAEDAPGVYRGDPTRIRQILYNLLSNAMKFTAEGAVRLIVGRDPASGGIAITITDTGEGMAPDQLAKLFDKFVQADASTTRRHGGTGLGLAICRELAELMGGKVEVSSVASEGSSFAVTLPLERTGDARHIASPTAAPTASAEPLDVRILAAEDNPMNQLVLKTLLHQAGVELTLVSNGEEAVAAWRSQAWDIILMDVQMPVMDGLAATRAIRAEEAQSGRPRTHIIALTANAMAHQVAEYRAVGMDDHVAKPIDASLLYQALSNAPEPADGKAAAQVA